jgi:YD repeat-containing protein
MATPVTAPVLDVYGTSVTASPVGGWSTFSAVPRFDQRGVDIDGTLRAPVPLGWAVAADPLGGGYSNGRKLGDVNLATGSYNPTDIDLALPTIGPPIVIGRTYNNLQGGASRNDVLTPQGYNWYQVSQPQIALNSGVTADLDVLYLYYGNDRFIELQRTGLTSNEFKAKNGAAGVVTFTAAAGSDPELYTYYDQAGNQTVFFGFDGNSGSAVGQLWKMVDRAGNVAYVHSTTATTAVSTYGSGFGRMQYLFDASGRKYAFSYSLIGSGVQITKVEAQLYISSVWTTIAQVDYDYYSTTDNDKGKSGDLRLVTITMPGLDDGAGHAASYVRRKYYRYYTRAWSNSDGRRGEAHSLKMVVGFDGTRKYDVTDNNFDQDYYAETDANLMPYSESYFEYPSGDYRLASATFSGNCGCGGGTSGTYTFSYSDASGYSTAIANTSYDTGWGRRTIIVQPDGTYVTQYFDETGAPLSRVMTNSDPSGSPTKTWVTGVDRDSSGLVTTIHSPANCTGYTHSTGSMTYSTSAGLVTSYTRHSASDNLDGLRESVTVKEGTSGSATTTGSVSFSERQLLVGSNGAVSIPQVDTVSTYPDYSTAQDTGYGYSYWSATDTDPLYLAPKSITTTNPTVSLANNGSNSATTSVRYLREDGTTAITKDSGGTLFYTGRSAYGQTATRIADWDGSTLTNVVSEDKPGGTLAWSVSAGGSGTPIQALSTMTYDDQGRMLTSTRPSANGTITAANFYILDSYELGTISYPRKVSTTYYGPAHYTRVNHAGKADQSIMFQCTGGTSSPTIPSSSDWSARVDMVYDSSGMRATEVHTYTVDNSTYDTATVGYDAMGRRARSVDATGTVTRMVFDERGKVIEKWTGTDDYGWTDPAGVGSSSDMVKVEELEYDGGASGGNGYLTALSQSSDGAWSGGVGDRVTTYINDYRGRAVVQENPVAPHVVTAYDNSNRVTAVAKYSSTSGLSVSTDPTATSASTRVALTETAYDQRGQVFQSTLWEIIQSGGSAGNKNSSQVTSNWYDDGGRLVKTLGQKHTKTFYDRLGRVLDRFVIAKTDDGSTYSNALNVSGDIVLEQSHSAIDPASGRVLAQWTVGRAHDDYTDGTSGALDTNADSDPLVLTSGNIPHNARPQITATWYDDWDRVRKTANYGNNGGSTFDRTSVTEPTSSSVTTCLMSVYTYEGFGRVETVTDSASIVNKIVYDFAGRRAATIDNYVNGTPHTTDGSNHDQDRRTDYGYTDGLVTSVKREMPDNGGSTGCNDQTTSYTYGTTLMDSQVASGHLLGVVTNPDSTTTTYSYNALSQVASTTDPAGNVIETSYDAGGRVILRDATTINTTDGFDDRVEKIETSYNSRGMVAGTQQKDSGGTVLDEVALDYDGWGNLASSTQDPDSAIGAASGRDEYAMTWSWGRNSLSGGNKAIYLSSWTQPDGASGANYYVTYEASGYEPEKYAKRALRVSDDYATIAEYTYIGSNTVIGTDTPETALKMTFMFTETGSANYGTYLDRFNRIILDRWRRDYSMVNPKILELEIAYDVAGNATTVQDDLMLDAGGNRSFDRLRDFDALRRLTEQDEGQLNAGTITGSDFKRQEILERNLAGRITSDKIDLDPNDMNTYFDNGPPSAPDAGEMDDNRTYNSRNQLTGRDYYDSSHLHTASRHPVTPAYDDNGNLTSDGETYDYVYNPFGQLVAIKLKGTSTYAAKYTYNGFGQRISEQLDTNNTSGITKSGTYYAANSGVTDGVVNSDDPVFFIAVDPQGRRVATFRNTDTYPKEMFAYHQAGMSARGDAYGPAFKGGLILRERNASLTDSKKWATETASATRGERHYYLSDFQGSVVALVDSSSSVVEQYRYASSGIPIGIPLGNVSLSGTTSGTGTDYGIVNNDITNHVYEFRADLNLDGVVDSGDLAIVSASNGKSSGRGYLTVASVANRNGAARREYFGSVLSTLSFGQTKVSLVGISTDLEESGCPDSLATRIRMGIPTDSTCQSCGLSLAVASPAASDTVLASQRPPAGGFPGFPAMHCYKFCRATCFGKRDRDHQACYDDLQQKIQRYGCTDPMVPPCSDYFEEYNSCMSSADDNAFWCFWTCFEGMLRGEVPDIWLE